MLPAAHAIAQSSSRKPRGLWYSPYSAPALSRYLLNFFTNGYFSYKNPDRSSMQVLPQEGTVALNDKKYTPSATKIIFLGDIMVSASGNPPILDDSVKRLLQSADIIVANVESPLVESQGGIIKRCGSSLQFKMDATYLQVIYDYNKHAQWVMSIANNHACDTSDKGAQDVSGLIATAALIKKYMPNATVIGAHVGSAQSVVAVQLQNGVKIGCVAWTDLMNNDALHVNKPVVRGEDIRPQHIQSLKNDAGFDLLIGFAHGNEEQSYEPLKATRDRWRAVTSPAMFDVIVGTGPHVAHAGERHNERLVLHSIGNFCSPKGSSQTKVGLIPELTVHADTQGIKIAHKTHFMQQTEKLSLFSLDKAEAAYPEIAHRLKSLWPQ